MKKSLLERSSLFRALLSLFLLVAMAGNAWGEECKIVFKTSTSDGSKLIEENANLDNVIESGKEYVSTFTSNCVKAYYASKSGVKLGTSSAIGRMEFKLSNLCNQKIKSIKIVSTKYNTDAGTLSLYYNESNVLKTGITVGEDYTHTFQTPRDITSIRLSTSEKRAYISEIIITTESGTEESSLSWSNSIYTATKGGDNTFPTLTKTPSTLSGISYTSSNTDVATINASSGAINLITGGKTTITASFAGNSEYTASSASYTLIVDDGSVFYDFNDINSYPNGFPSNKDGSIQIGTPTLYTISNNQLILYAPKQCYILNNSSDPERELFFGETSQTFSNSAYIEFPGEAEYVIDKIVVATGPGTGEMQLNVFNSNGDAMSTTATTTSGKIKNYTFTLNNPTVNTSYRLTSQTGNNNIHLFTVNVYYKTPQINIPTPTFSVQTGTYTNAQKVTVTNYNGNEYLYYYTLDGTDPTHDTSSGDPTGTTRAYEDNENGITINSTTTLKMIAADLDGNVSEIATATYTISEPVVETYTLTIKNPENGSIVVKDGETELKSGAKVETGKTISIEAKPDADYGFSGWDIQGVTVTTGNKSTSFTMPSGKVTISASFTKKDPASFEYTVHAKVGSQFQGLTFSNNLGAAATYSSSNTSIAEVDSQTGKVTIVGTGTATITYTVESTDEINEATQTYTIEVE